MAANCSKCKRKQEKLLEGSGNSLCYLCIGEGVNLIGVIGSLSYSGLKPADRVCKCSICSRNIKESDEAVSSEYGYVCYNCIQFFQRDLASPINVHLGEKKQWLVKNGLKIAGPFNEQRIRDDIQNRELSALDELCKPRGFWKYVRDLDDFKVELKEAQTGSGREHNTVDITKSMTGSYYGTDPQISESPRTAKTIDVEPRALYSMSENSAGKNFITGKVIPFFLGAAFLAGAAFVGKKVFEQKASVISFDELKARHNLKEYFEKGKYFAYQQEAGQIQSNGFALSDEEALNLVLSYLATDDVFNAAAKLSGISEEKYFLEKKLVRSKLAFLEGRGKEALSILEKIGNEYRQDPRFLINLAFLKTFFGSARESLLLIPGDVSLEALNSNRLLTYLYANWKANRKMTSAELEEIKRDSRSYVDSQASIGILLSMNYIRSGKQLEGLEMMSKALNYHPKNQESYIQDQLMIPHRVRWEIISNQISSMNGGEASMKNTLIAVAEYHSGNLRAAKDYINRAWQANRKNALIAAWRSFFDKKEITGVPSNIDPLYLKKTSPFQLSLVADQCIAQEKNPCIEKTLRYLIDLNSKDIYSIERYIRHLEKTRGRAEAGKVFRQYFGAAPRYIPFLEMEERLL